MNEDIQFLSGGDITEIRKIISIYEFYLGPHPVKIKIYLDEHGKYQFVNSHLCKHPDQGDYYRSSMCNFDSEGEALIHAKNQYARSFSLQGLITPNSSY